MAWWTGRTKYVCQIKGNLPQIAWFYNQIKCLFEKLDCCLSSCKRSITPSLIDWSISINFKTDHPAFAFIMFITNSKPIKIQRRDRITCVSMKYGGAFKSTHINQRGKVWHSFSRADHCSLMVPVQGMAHGESCTTHLYMCTIRWLSLILRR